MKQSNMRSGIKEYGHKLNVLLRLLLYCRSVAPKEMAIVLTITIIKGFSTIVILFALQNLIDAIYAEYLSVEGDFTTAIFWVIVLILTILINRLLETLGRIPLDHAQEIVKVKCKEEIMDKAYRLSLSDFDRSLFHDRLSRVNQGMDERFFSTMTFIFQMMTQTITVVSILMYLIFMHWLIPVVLGIGSFVFTLVYIKVFKEKYVLHREQTTSARKLDYLGKLMTSRDAASEIRLYGLRNHLLQEWRSLNMSLLGERLKLNRREFRLRALSSGGHTLIFASVLLGIILLGTRGVLSVGQYAAFVRAVISFQNELNGLMLNVASVHDDLRYIDEFFSYLDLDEEKRDGIHPASDQSIKETIAFDQIAFSYPGNESMVVKDLNLKIKAGEKNCISRRQWVRKIYAN